LPFDRWEVEDLLRVVDALGWAREGEGGWRLTARGATSVDAQAAGAIDRYAISKPAKQYYPALPEQGENHEPVAMNVTNSKE
jgi:hypothetical protein